MNLTRHQVRKLSKIHWAAITSFQYVTDKELYGKIEHWEVPEKLRGIFKGDCEDFALYCRKICRNEGITTQLIYCYVEADGAGANGGRGHCVLHAEGYILDNRRRQLATTDKLEKAGYEFIAMSGDNPGQPWHYINEAAL